MRRATASALSIVMLALSVAIPELERADLTHEAVLESEHNPATCPPGHDHTICTQVSASFSAPSRAPTYRQPNLVHDLPASAERPTPRTSVTGGSHRSRAPPAV